MTVFTIQKRRDTKAGWEAANPVLAPGERGYEAAGVGPDGSLRYDTDPGTGRALVPYKMGDGKTAWRDLPYAAGPVGPQGLAGDVTVPEASAAVRGRARLATAAETNAQAVGDAAVSPAGLGAAGAARFAGPDELTAQGLLISPARVAEAAAGFALPEATEETAGAVRLADPDDAAAPPRAAVTPAGARSMLAAAGLTPGILAWDAESVYTQRVLVSGPDGAIYRWLAPSGPGTPAGPQSPAAPPAVDPVLSPALSAWAGPSSLPASVLYWRYVALNDSGQAVAAPSISGTGYTCQSYDQAARSADGGQSWTVSTLPAKSHWVGLAINNAGRAFTSQISGAAGARSHDGGKTWSPVSYPEFPAGGGFSDVALNDRDVVLVTGLPWGRILRSPDFGATWQTPALPMPANWLAVDINSRGQAVALAQYGQGAAWSDDGGLTWTAATLPASAFWFDVAVNNRGQALAVAGDRAIRSDDGGRTWTTAALPAMAGSAGYQFVALNDAGCAVATSDSYTAAWSADAGRTWAASAMPTPTFVGVALNHTGRAVAVRWAGIAQVAVADFPLLGYAADWSPCWAPFGPAPVGSAVGTGTPVVPRDCLPFDGGLYARADYPALWRFIETFGRPAADGAWTANLFSDGDGAATFRVPDRAQAGPVYTYLKAK